jgi:hypothetical protein
LLPVSNSVPFDGGSRSINWMAPTNAAKAPISLANAPKESADASTQRACIVTGSASATGVTVSRANALSTVKPASEMVPAAGKFAVPSVNVADCLPVPPLDKVKLAAPEVVNEGAVASRNSPGNVTVNSVPVVRVVVAVYVTRHAGTTNTP